MAEREFVILQSEYESLISLAREGAATHSTNKVLQLEEWLIFIERRHNIVRSIVWVQWQELDNPLPPTTNFPDVWPPELRRKIELISRPVAKVDVEQVLDQFARSPETILCTRDPAGILGWTPIDDFFTN